jgi:hypothetical protein
MIKNELPQVKITLINMIFPDLNQLLKLVRVYPQIVKLDLRIVPCDARNNGNDELLLLKIITTMKENSKSKINVKFHNTPDSSILLSYDGTTELVYNSNLTDTDTSSYLIRQAISQYIKYIMKL